MYKLILLAFLVLSVGEVIAQTDNPMYDKPLADSLGGDDYGMKMYTFVILKNG